jgi:biotin synthase-like enzyme
MVRGVKDLGLETCCTLGMLKDGQAEALAGAGLDYYNHNLDTSPEFYGEIVTTRAHRIGSTRSTACAPPACAFAAAASSAWASRAARAPR